MINFAVKHLTWNGALLSLILPEGLSDYFEFDKVEPVAGSTYIYLIEKNIHPKEFADDKLLSKGFASSDYKIRNIC